MTFHENDVVVHAQRGLFEDRSGRVGTVISLQRADNYLIEFDNSIEVLPGNELELIGGKNGTPKRQ
jgi:hypothetical protein